MVTNFQEEEDELDLKDGRRVLQAALPFVKICSHPQSFILSFIRIRKDKKLNISAVYR